MIGVLEVLFGLLIYFCYQNRAVLTMNIIALAVLFFRGGKNAIIID